MRKERLAYFKKRLIEKQRQLADEVGRTAIYGKDQEDDSIKDLGDQANTAYNMEFFFELVPQGQLTPRLYALKTGDRVLIRHRAKGAFTLDRANTHKDHFFVTTVTGIAPVVSIVRTLRKEPVHDIRSTVMDRNR